MYVKGNRQKGIVPKELWQKKKKGRSLQEMIGIKSFTGYGLATNKGELLFYQAAPTNISVLSHASIEAKIRHLLMVLSALPDIGITCTDSSECFDDNKTKMYLGQKNAQVEEELAKAPDTLYNKSVPAGVRDFIDMRAGVSPVSVQRPPQRAKPLPSAVMVDDQEGKQNG